MTTGYNYERRKQRALERLGSNDPRCFLCGESDWRCLEAHHIAGHAHDEATVPVCRNCHRKLSDCQKDHPVETVGGDSELEAIGRFLLGVADLFRLLVDKLSEWGGYLIDLAVQTNAGAREEMS